MSSHVAEACRIQWLLPVHELHAREASLQQRDQPRLHARCYLGNVAGGMGDEPDDAQLVSKISCALQDQQSTAGVLRPLPDRQSQLRLPFRAGSQ